MILLFGAATIALLSIIPLLIRLERQDGGRAAIEGSGGWEDLRREDLAILLLAIIAMALACGAGLLGAPRRTRAPHAPAANRAPAAVAAIAPGSAAPPAATPSPTATPQPATATPQPAPTATLAAAGAPGSAVPASAAAGPQARAAVDRARARFARVGALHFALTTRGGLYLDAGRTQALTAAEGDLLRPDRVSLTATLSAGPATTQLRLIEIGGDAYLANMATGTWEKAPAGFSYDAGALFDPGGGVPAILERGRDWQPVEAMTVDGVETQHVRGPVPAASVNALVGSPMRGEYVDVDLYIRPTTADIVRVVVSEQPSAAPADVPPARWTLDLSEQDEAIAIEAPTLGG